MKRIIILLTIATLWNVTLACTVVSLLVLMVAPFFCPRRAIASFRPSNTMVEAATCLVR